jgi:hypothetical protein
VQDCRTESIYKTKQPKYTPIVTFTDYRNVNIKSILFTNQNAVVRRATFKSKKLPKLLNLSDNSKSIVNQVCRKSPGSINISQNLATNWIIANMKFIEDSKDEKLLLICLSYDSAPVVFLKTCLSSYITFLPWLIVPAVRSFADISDDDINCLYDASTPSNTND